MFVSTPTPTPIQVVKYWCAICKKKNVALRSKMCHHHQHHKIEEIQDLSARNHQILNKIEKIERLKQEELLQLNGLRQSILNSQFVPSEDSIPSFFKDE